MSRVKHVKVKRKVEIRSDYSNMKLRRKKIGKIDKRKKNKRKLKNYKLKQQILGITRR